MARSRFVYDPHTLRSVVFEESNERSTKRRKARKAVSAELVSRRDIVLENDDEQYVYSISPYGFVLIEFLQVHPRAQLQRGRQDPKVHSFNPLAQVQKDRSLA